MRNQDQVSPAVDRLYRAYLAYCTHATEDQLFMLLTALHSLDDRINERHGRLMLEIPDWVALKSLRNYLHHEGEIRHSVRVKSLAGRIIDADLMEVCLISRDDFLAALDGVKEQFKADVAEAAAATFKDWGDVVDINPCIFNCLVKVFELLQRLGLKGNGSEYESFAQQYNWETANGHSHYVTGRVSLLTSGADAFAGQLKRLYEEV